MENKAYGIAIGNVHDYCTIREIIYLNKVNAVIQLQFIVNSENESIERWNKSLANNTYNKYIEIKENYWQAGSACIFLEEFDIYENNL